MFYVNFIFDDSSRLSWLVEASDERSAVNAILNTTKMTKNPKFVVCEKPNVIANDDDIDLLSKFESWGGEYDNVFMVQTITMKTENMLQSSSYIMTRPIL